MPDGPTRLQARGGWGFSKGRARARRGTADIHSRREVRRKKNLCPEPAICLLEGFWEEVALTLGLEEQGECHPPRVSGRGKGMLSSVTILRKDLLKDVTSLEPEGQWHFWLSLSCQTSDWALTSFLSFWYWIINHRAW